MKFRFTLFIMLCFYSFSTFSDLVRFDCVVLDAESEKPMKNVDVIGSFSDDIGWRAWTESAPQRRVEVRTDESGRCHLQGKTNCGKAGCFVRNPPQGYYHPAKGWRYRHSGKDLFGVWQPDNLVATIRLQRVEHPIPLCVKRVELRDYERGIGGFDGTNSVLKFDLMKGDWLPPYGKGEVADMRIDTRVDRTGTVRRFLPQDGQWGVLQFYDFVARVELHDGDYLLPEVISASAGIKIRSAGKEAVARSITRTKGKRKQVDKNKDWRCEYFSDSNPDRCYTFRIRTRRNDKSELVEAYYGKIYGDFEFEGDDKKGLIGVKFLYYLNPTSLDRNLEWDMKSNLCPNPGSIGQHLP